MISIVFLFSGAKEQSRFANSEAYENIMLLFSQIVERTDITLKTQKFRCKRLDFFFQFERTVSQYYST